MKTYERLEILEVIADSVQKALDALDVVVRNEYGITFYEEDDGSKWLGVKMEFSEPGEDPPHYTDLKKVIEGTGADDVRPLFQNGEWKGVELYYRKEV